MLSDPRDLIEAVEEASLVPDTNRLGSAEWMPLKEQMALQYIRDRPLDKTWLGEALVTPTSPLGYDDERHVCLVSGTGGGKGTGSIIPNLCLWPGSAIVLDIKGENAPITARRRGAGSEYTIGMGQAVHILDPYSEIDGFNDLKATFNPLDSIDPASDTAVRDAGLVAGGMVVETKDSFFDQWAKDLIAALILHVLTFEDFADARNLVTVRELISGGHREAADYLEQQAASTGTNESFDPFHMLWSSMRRNRAFNGFVSRMGESIQKMDHRTSSSILASASTNTYFLEGMPMRRQVSTSSFKMSDLKLSQAGMTVYLSVPRRYLDDDFRWLRVIVNIAIGEMERIKTLPATNAATLFLLDEFASLKKMKVIEDAVAQGRGAGLKFFFVVQNFTQLLETYGKSWENFVSNCGVILAYHVLDNFTRDYLSKKIGNRELIVRTNTGGRTETLTEGSSDAISTGDNSSRSTASMHGFNSGSGHSFGGEKTIFNSNSGRTSSFTTTVSRGRSSGRTVTKNHSTSIATARGFSESAHSRPLCSPDEIERCFARVDDADSPAHPGLLLGLIGGKRPLVAGRINYFDSIYFEGLFDPHPSGKYKKPLTLKQRQALREEAEREEGLRRQRLKQKEEEATGLKTLALASAVILLFVAAVVFAILPKSQPHQPTTSSLEPAPKPAITNAPAASQLTPTEASEITTQEAIAPKPKPRRTARPKKTCAELNGEMICE